MYKDFQILTFIDLYVLLCFVFHIVSKGKPKQPYCNTVNNDHISPNTVSQNDEIPHTARLDDTAIPHVKIKITEIPHEKKPNTVNPHVPLHFSWIYMRSCVYLRLLHQQTLTNI